eukprot:TRINITY_DN10592_c0_g1_i1.p1 TRINITY_DN10592_c0_g1~~TRINITY_DN10592_c0_g1_i1.p1  ORF type:complete len:121 (+),score=16.02 TRINITY_DN10592_c0_g1_i1:277-639(+)
MSIEEYRIRSLVGQLHVQRLFKSFIFDDDNIWVGIYSQKLKQILSFALLEYQQEDESEETFWKFINTSIRFDSHCLARNMLQHSMNKRNSIIEIRFPVEKLELFVGLFNKLIELSHGDHY